MNKKKQLKQNKPATKTTITSLILNDGTIVETVFDPDQNQTGLAVFQHGNVEIKSQYLVKEKDGSRRFLVPVSSNNELLKNRLVMFPSRATDYGSKETLVHQVKQFVNKYVDLTDEMQIATAYYVLLTWVYDDFNELPYLRKVGDFGSGKTRFLKVIGSICYKAMFVSGGTSTAALFHIIDQFRGTLIIDEADFHFSDEKASISKILNNGNALGFPILRVSQNKDGKFRPISYNVYCPKILASRGYYQDQALESRFITESYRLPTARTDIPVSLPKEFDQEALELRNKLLMFRFRTASKIEPFSAKQDADFEGRVNQIFRPLLSMVSNQNHIQALMGMASHYSQQFEADRLHTTESQILSIIKSLREEAQTTSIKTITNKFILEHSDYYDRRITSKWVGFVIRKKLGLNTRKSNGNFILDESGLSDRLKKLYDRYGVTVKS